MSIAALLLALIVTPGAEGSRGPVLLDFHSSSCGPCVQMRPVVAQLIHNGYPVRSVNVEESPELAERYRVTAIPTFIVIDGSGRSVARTQGYQPATELAGFYRAAKAKVTAAAPPDEEIAAEGRDTLIREGSADDEPEARPAPKEDRSAARAHKNPNPWETVVRIKVHGNGSIGFGSGTIVYSTPDESIILTCAHIFKLEGQRNVPAARFQNRIDIDLFDGRLASTDPPHVTCIETVAGQAMDYDFGLDVGLIRIRPGRRLPASRIVSADWRARSGLPMTTVGCSEGHDATAWSTKIVRPAITGLTGTPNYQAIECTSAPRQGRSGGGLYTMDGYVAGVCDFAEPRGDHGLYATPRSIYAILDRNRLTALYKPSDGGNGRLMAESRPAPKRKAPPSIARAQSPDNEDGNAITMPPPDLLNIHTPQVAQSSASGETTRSRQTWRPSAPGIPARPAAEQTTDLKLSPEMNNDQFLPTIPPAQPETPPQVSSTVRGKSKWRSVPAGASAIASSEER